MAFFRNKDRDYEERELETAEGMLEVQQRTSLTEIEADRQRQAFDVGFPTPSQLKPRIPLIARVDAREIPIYVRAKVQLALIKALKTGTTPKIDDVSPLETLLELTVSVKGKGREEIVEISKVQSKTQKKGGWFRR